MTAGVVDHLELVEIEVAQGVGRLARLGALQRPFQARLEFRPVDKAGEDVVTGVVGEPAVQFARLADIVEHEDRAGHVAAVVPDRCRGALDVDLVAVAADEQRRAYRLDRARAADGDCERVFERLAGLLVEAAEHLVDLAPGGLLELPSGQLLGHRIEVLDVALGIGGDHAVADRLQRDLGALLLPEERLFVDLLLGDVVLHADQPAQAAVGVEQCAGAAVHPAPLPVLALHAVHALEERRLAGDVIAQLRLHLRQLRGVHQAAPVDRRPGHVLLGVAHDGEPARREVQPALARIEVPGAVVGGGDHHRVALVDLGEPPARLGALQSGSEARGEQLQQQLVIGVPLRLRLAVEKGDEAGVPAGDVEADQQHGRTVEGGEPGGVGCLGRRGGGGIGDAEQAQVREAAREPRPGSKRLALQHFGVDTGEGVPRGEHPLHALALGIEKRHADRVAAGPRAHRIHAFGDEARGIGIVEVLEIDRDLGEGDVEAAGRPRGTEEPLQTGERRAVIHLASALFAARGVGAIPLDDRASRRGIVLPAVSLTRGARFVF